VVGVVGLQLVVVLLATHAGDAPRVADQDPRSPVESVLEVVAYHAEERQPHPASAHRARTGHPVTFAFLSHLRRNVHSAGFVIVQVHHVAYIAALLAGVDEFAREFDSKLDVV